MHRLRRSLILAVAALGLAATAPVADAAVGPPLAIDGSVDAAFDEPSATALTVGVSDGGDAVAAWRGVGSQAGAVKLALWRAGEARPRISDGGLGRDPAVTMAPDGRALAAWTGSDGRLRIAHRMPGGAFGPATAIAPPSVMEFQGRWDAPAVALAPDGRGIVAAPSCIDFGGPSRLSAHVVAVGADGAIGAAEETPVTLSSLGCPSQIGVARVVAGSDGRTAFTVCIQSFYCQLAIRAGAGAAWTADGVDGTAYGPSTDEAQPVIAPDGRVLVTWLSTASRYPTLFAASGTDATAMSTPAAVSDGAWSTAAGDLLPLRSDALALFQTSANGGGHDVLARPVFAPGTLGDLAPIAPRTFQLAAPYADPHGASWPDGTALVALAAQPTARATPALAVVQRSLGGTPTPLDVGAQTNAVTVPRVAVAGTPAQPHGLLATREQPAGGGTATIVLRRIDGAAPRVTVQAPPTVTAGQPVRLSATVEDMSGAAAIGWSLGDGATAQGPVVDHVFSGAGPRTVVVTVTDALGNAGGATATVQVVAAVGPDPSPGADITNPELRRVRLSATRFRAGRANTAVAARGSAGAAMPAAHAAASARRRRRASAPAGTSLRFDLSEAATVRVAVVRVRNGRTQRGRCRAGARRGKRCQIRSTTKTFTRRLPAGAASIPFSARFGGRALGAGGYELQLVPTDAAGNRGATRAVRFTLVR